MGNANCLLLLQTCNNENMNSISEEGNIYMTIRVAEFGQVCALITTGLRHNEIQLNAS